MVAALHISLTMLESMWHTKAHLDSKEYNALASKAYRGSLISLGAGAHAQRRLTVVVLCVCVCVCVFVTRFSALPLRFG